MKGVLLSALLCLLLLKAAEAAPDVKNSMDGDRVDP